MHVSIDSVVSYPCLTLHSNFPRPLVFHSVSPSLKIIQNNKTVDSKFKSLTGEIGSRSRNEDGALLN